MFVASFATALTGYSMAYASEKLIHYWDQYDQTMREACEDDDVNKCDTRGTAVQWDWIITHGLTTAYTYFVLTGISYGGYIFYLVFDPLNDTPECNWDVDTSHYDGVGAIIGQIKDYESCAANIGDIFKKMDLNNDGYLERCEDANF
jgi:hypothetical protein